MIEKVSEAQKNQGADMVLIRERLEDADSARCEGQDLHLPVKTVKQFEALEKKLSECAASLKSFVFKLFYYIEVEYKIILSFI
ncbi:MAG: hypothetical protein ACK518_02795 [bacterium]